MVVGTEAIITIIILAVEGTMEDTVGGIMVVGETQEAMVGVDGSPVGMAEGEVGFLGEIVEVEGFLEEIVEAEGFPEVTVEVGLPLDDLVVILRTGFSLTIYHC